MRRHVLVPLLLVAGACRSDLTVPSEDPVEAGVVGDGRLEVVLDTLRARRGLPSLAAILVHDGAVVEVGAVGIRAVGHGEEVTADDRWHLGSLTKAMTGTLAGVLVESGVIDWSTTVAEVFPDFVGVILPGYEDLRLEELLYHTAGLPMDATAVPSWPDIVAGNGTIRELRRQWASELLQRDPEGARGEWEFTDAGYIVAGAILEEVTGEVWEDLLMREVFEPLGMSATGFGAPGTVGMVDQPWGHLATPSGLVALDPGEPLAGAPAALGPAETVHASLAAFAPYMIAHLAGARGQPGLVSAATFDKLHTPAPNTSYAVGWGVVFRAWAGGAALTHNASDARWHAAVWLAPQRDIGVLAVTNVAGEPAFVGVDDAVLAMVARFDASPAAAVR